MAASLERFEQAMRSPPTREVRPCARCGAPITNRDPRTLYCDLHSRSSKAGMEARIRLHRGDMPSWEEIGQALGISRQTALNDYHRAMAKLRKALDDHQEGYAIALYQSLTSNPTHSQGALVTTKKKDERDEQVTDATGHSDHLQLRLGG